MSFYSKTFVDFMIPVTVCLADDLPNRGFVGAIVARRMSQSEQGWEAPGFSHRGVKLPGCHTPFATEEFPANLWKRSFAKKRW